MQVRGSTGGHEHCIYIPVMNADPEATKPVIIDVHEPGSRLIENAVPIPTKETACIELLGMAESCNHRA